MNDNDGASCTEAQGYNSITLSFMLVAELATSIVLSWRTMKA